MLKTDVSFRRDGDTVAADFALTPASWLAMLPQVVAQLEPEAHENFVLEVLRALDLAGAEVAGCMCDEFVIARNWM